MGQGDLLSVLLGAFSTDKRSSLANMGWDDIARARACKKEHQVPDNSTMGCRGPKYPLIRGISGVYLPPNRGYISPHMGSLVPMAYIPTPIPQYQALVPNTLPTAHAVHTSVPTYLVPTQYLPTYHTPYPPYPPQTPNIPLFPTSYLIPTLANTLDPY